MSIDMVYMALSRERDWDLYRVAMRVRCPWCKSNPGVACHVNGVPLSTGDKIHPSRARKGLSEATE